MKKNTTRFFCRFYKGGELPEGINAIMRIEYLGHTKKYELDCMADLFYPGKRLLKEDDFAVVSKVDSNIAYTDIIHRGKTFSHAQTFNVEDDKDLKRAVKLSFFRSAVEDTGITPPYGIFTGIRPAKPAIELLRQGLSAEDAERQMTREYCMQPEKAKLCVSAAVANESAMEKVPGGGVSLYISIPFCPSRCAYCSFVSVSVEKTFKLLPSYLEMLRQELTTIADNLKSSDEVLTSLYIGGGTPTVLSASQLQSLLEHIFSVFDLSGLLEFSVEAGRPDTLDSDKLYVLRSFGDLRISINTQTLSDDILKSIGRRHTVKEFFNCFNEARKIGFNNINVDLIAGLPGETEESFINSVDGVLSLDPENITVHSFAVKRAANLTLLTGGGYTAKSESAEAMQKYSQKVLAQNGYNPYYLYRQRNTVSNLENIGYCKNGKMCLYNIYMMNEQMTVYAAGAGGVSKILRPDGLIVRSANCKYPYEYIDRGQEKGLL